MSEILNHTHLLLALVFMLAWGSWIALSLSIDGVRTAVFEARCGRLRYGMLECTKFLVVGILALGMTLLGTLFAALLIERHLLMMKLFTLSIW